MIWPMLALAWMFNIVERGSAAYSRIRAMLSEAPVVNDGTEPVPEGRGVMNVDIRTFVYPQTEHPVLENVSFTLQPGQMLGSVARRDPVKVPFFRCSSVTLMSRWGTFVSTIFLSRHCN